MICIICTTLDIKIVKLSDFKKYPAELVTKYYDCKDWCVRYYYCQTENETVYLDYRIDGLDEQLYKLIPEDELAKFENKVLNPD